MGQLIYAAITSFDGYVEDQKGNFDWGTPDDEVFAFITEMERPIGTYLYGRRMYETMRYWETAHLVSGQTAHLVPVQPDSSRDFAEVWRAADKIVYSTTAETVESAKTRVERDFDVDAVRHLKLSSEHDMTVGGANLAAQAIKAGLVDELQ